MELLEETRESANRRVDNAVKKYVTPVAWASEQATHTFEPNENCAPGKPLYDAFVGQILEMSTSERELLICFHGTGRRNLRSICREGLDSSKRGSACGQKLGPGEYFAQILCS